VEGEVSVNACCGQMEGGTEEGRCMLYMQLEVK